LVSLQIVVAPEKDFTSPVLRDPLLFTEAVAAEIGPKPECGTLHISMAG
jgi:hypothetical protein